MNQEFKCMCHQCLIDRDEKTDGIPLGLTMMIVCPICGNKRCPHATDHRHDCSGSNEPGQDGSIFGTHELKRTI